jgi:DNA phosphorothioation-dependent restriction protein DptH
MGEVFSSEESEVVDFKELLDGRVLVVALDKLGADQKLKNALVILFLNLYYEYMLEAEKWPFQGANPQLRRLNSFLLVDEATNIMQYEFDVLMTLMLQGREFGFGTILASQYLSHFNVGSSNYGEPLLTWFIHRVPQATPQDFKKVGLQDISKNTTDRVPMLGLHEAVYRSLGINGRVIRGTPFYEMLE